MLVLFNTGTGGGPIPHAGTFNANPITMAAGIATMEQLTEPVYARLNAMGDRLRDRLQVLGDRYRAPIYVSGIGSMFKIHFSEAPVRCYRDTLQTSTLLHTALFLFGLLGDSLGELSLGVNLRPSHLRFEFGGTSSTRDLLMNADVTGAWRHGGFTLYGEFGRQPLGDGELLDDGRRLRRLRGTRPVRLLLRARPA